MAFLLWQWNEHILCFLWRVPLLIATTTHWMFGALNCSRMMVQWMCTDSVIQLWSQKADKKNCYLCCKWTVTSSLSHDVLDFKWSDIQCVWWQFNLNQNTKGIVSINIIIVDAILISVYCRPMSTKHLTSTVHLSNPLWPWTLSYCFFACYCHIVCLW